VHISRSVFFCLLISCIALFAPAAWAQPYFINGTVTDSGTASGIEGVQIDFHNETEYVGSAFTDVNGDFSFETPADGNYYAFTPNYGIPTPYLPDVWDDADGTYCPFQVCDFRSVGSAIAVFGADANNINLALDSGFTISGTVLDGGSPVDGIGICIHLTTGEWTAVCGGTDPSGNYTTGVLPPGSNYVAYTIGYELGYAEQMWNSGGNVDCGPNGCDWSFAEAIDLCSGDATGIDFRLDPSDPGIIRGYIYDASDQPTPGGGVFLIDQNGDRWGHFWTDETGYWESHPLPTGTYYAVTQYHRGFIEDVWDGGDGAQCPNQLCNPQDREPIGLNSGSTREITFRLDEITNGGTISGNVSDGVDPLPFVRVELRNNQGQYIEEIQTNPAGNYSFGLRIDDSYYVRARQVFGTGLAGELWDDHQCIPDADCSNDNYVFNNGTPISTNGGDVAADFILSDTGAERITGQVTDAGTGKPLTNIGLELHLSDGTHVDNTETDAQGNYVFLNLGPGTYNVLASGVPEGYQPEFYLDEPCNPEGCDPSTQGTDIVLSGSGGVANIELDYAGTRIFGNVTRSDNGDPVPSDFAYFGIVVFNSSGIEVGRTGTDKAGNYQLYLPESGGSATYYVSTDHDIGYHALINECWANIQCPDPFDPLGGGATPIELADGTTEVADFVLDPAQVISGMVTESDGVTPIANVQVDIWNSAGEYVNSGVSQGGGVYQVPVPGPGDYYVFTPDYGVPAPYLPEAYPNQSCYVSAGCDPTVEGSAVNVAGAASTTGIDFQLDIGYTISGTVLDDGSNPIDGIGVCIHLTTGEWTGVCGGTDGDGNYITNALPSGANYVAYAIAEDFGLQRQMYSGIDCVDFCDFSLGTAIDITSGNATGIDFSLNPAAPVTISGFIRNWSDEGVGGYVQLVQTNGDFFWSFWVDENGDFTNWEIPPGNYIVLTGGTWGYMEEVWDGGGGAECRNWLATCDYVNEGLVLNVPGGANISGINFYVDEVFQSNVISGTITDEGANPVPFVDLNLVSSVGQVIDSLQTNESGYYQFSPRVDGTYYVVANLRAIGGTAPELWDDVQCIPSSNCYDPGFITGNGSPLNLSGNAPGTDFVLNPSSGWVLSGRVTDNDNGKPLADVNVGLYDEFGGGIWSTDTGADGRYYFSGLDNGNYVVWAQGMPEGYTAEAWNNRPCEPGFCDPADVADVINVSGGDVTNVDIGLQYTGTRIMGTVTRSDTGDAVSSNFAWMGVHLFNDSGEQIDATGTDRAGNFQLHLPPSGGSATYFLRTGHDNGYHALIDECWDDVICENPDDPLNNGSTPIVLADGTTAVADFVLDPAQVISGTVTESDGVTPIPGIQLDLVDGSGGYSTSSITAGDGSYKLPVPGPGDYYVFTPPWGVLSTYVPEVWDNTYCDTNFGCDPVTQGNAVGVIGSADTTGIDFSLDQSASISGFVTSSVDGLGVWPQVRLYALDGTQVTAGNGNPDGTYTLGGIVPGTYYLLLVNRNGPLIDELYDDAQCPRLACDFATLGTQINVSAGDQLIGYGAALDPGSQISGTVLVDGAPPAAFTNVFIYDASGTYAGFAFTDETGFYQSRSGLPAGSYYVVFGDPESETGYTATSWPDAACGEPCDAALGDPVVVDGTNPVSGIDFNLSSAPLTSISGNITGLDTEAALEGIVLWLFDLNCTFLANAATDINGDYTIQTPGAGDYYLFAVGNDTLYLNLQTPYMNQQYPGINVFDTCYPALNDVTLGEVITTAEGEQLAGYDFVLEPGGEISGTIFDGGGILAEGKGAVRLYKTNGQQQYVSLNKEPDGSYRLGGILPGDYRVVLSSSNLGLVDERYDDIPCPRNSCDTELGQVFTFAGTEAFSGIDAVLSEGAVVRGTLTDADSGAPIPGYCVYFYTDGGVYAAVGCSDEFGNYQTNTGLPDGLYRMSNQFNGFIYEPVEGGYVSQVWTNDGSFVYCGEECDFLLGDTLVVSGTTAVENVDLEMSKGFTISGVLTDAVTANPVEGQRVCIGQLSTQSLVQRSCSDSDASGFWESPALSPAADYIPFALGRNTPYRSEKFDGTDCPFNWCDLTAGATVDISLGSVTNVNFELDANTVISGQIFDDNGGSPVPLASGRVRLYYPDGSDVPNTVVNTNGNGEWFIGSLLPGSYWLLSTTRNGNLMDEVWDDVVCPRLSCDPGASGATAIVVSDGDVIGGYDAILEPGSQLFGQLTENGNPYASGEVFIWDASGAYAGFGFANGDGNWNSFSGLPAGDYTVTTHRPGQIDANEGYLPMAWPNTPCGDPCDVLAGETINVDGTNDVSGINLDLIDPPSPGENLIWGVIAGDGIGSFGPDAYFEVFDGGYNYLGGDGTDQYGHYYAFIPDGDYWFNFYGSGQFSHYVSETQDGTQCPWNQCDFGSIAPLSTSEGSITRVDANLAEGVIFSGSVVQAGTTTGLENVSMEFADSGGNVVFGMGTEPDGLYSTPGLPTMNYYVVAKGQAVGFLTELYDNVVCPGGDCVSVAGDPGVVQFTPAPGDVYVANFDLDMGLTISGNVTDNLANPLQGIRVDIFDQSGTQVGFGDTDASGNYLAVLPGDGSYYALIAEWSSGDFVPEVWNDTPCNGCDPVANGSAIVVSGASVGNINFSLQAGNTLSGLVTAEDGGAGLAGVQVCTAQLAEFRWIACRDTDGSGYYEFTGLLRDDVVVWTQDLRGLQYVPEVWDNIPGTQWWTGTPIDLISANASADFALATSGSLSGTVIETVTGSPLEGAIVQLLSPQSGVVAEAWTDASGNYTIVGFTAGDYHLMALKSWEGWIREVYPGQNVHGSPGDRGETPSLLSVAGGENLSGFDFDLDLGGVIWGTVRNDDDVILRGNARQVRLYDAAGKTLNINWNGDQADQYNLGGIIPGTYWVLGSSRLQGLVDELFDDVPCPRLSCGTEPGVPIVIAPGDVVVNVDFTLGSGSTISGRLTDAETGDGLAFFDVAIYDANGNYAGFGFSDADGYYTSYTAFPAGDYFVSNQFPEAIGGAPQGGYLPMVHNNLTCGDPCNVLLGDPVTLNGVSPVSGVDLALETGTELSGKVTTGGATPLQGVSVQLLAGDDGSVLRTVVSDSNGDWVMSGVGSGDYLLRTSNNLGYEDELHSNISCNPFCDPFSGTLIQPNGFGNNVPPVNFDLDLTPTISGTVTNEGAAPQANVLVGAYNTLGSLVATAVTDGSGDYTIGNLYEGSFFVKTANLAGYIDELYMDLDCLPGCNAKLGMPVLTSSATPATGIDLTLRSSSKITGIVRDSGAAPLSGITVEIYRNTGTFVGSDVTDGAGSYEVGGLSAGSYHAVTRNGFGYIDEGAGGVICQSSCSPVTTEVVAVGTNETVVVDYALDLGGAISGVVQDTALNPLGSVTVKAYNAAGVQIGKATTGPGGTYRIGGLAGGNVYLRTSNTSGFRNKRWNDLDCDALCDVLTGTSVAVSVNVEETGIDFQLALGGSISGVVSGSSGPIAGVLVNAYDTSSNLFAGSAVTAADGSYFIGGLEDDGYRLRTVNSVGYVDEWLDGDSCSPEVCLWNSGSVVTVASSDETGVDFNLARGDAISGVATDTMGIPLPSGTATVYSASGKVLKSGAITGGSFYVNGLANGTYYMVVFNGSGLVDELWSDIPCPGGSCNVTGGTPIVLAGAEAAEAAKASNLLATAQALTLAATAPRLVFEMDQGTILSGTVKSASDVPLQFKTVYILDSNGVLAGTAETDGLGHFETESGFPDGSYYATTSLLGQGGIGGGYIDEWFGGQLCTGECVGANRLGDPIVVPGGAVEAIDFVLDTGKSISGTVNQAAGGTPLPSTTIVLYDAGGAEAGTSVSNGAGAYSFQGLVPGDYYLKAIHPSGNYSDLLYNGTVCDSCDVTTGDAVTIETTDVSGVDFALSLVPDIDVEKFTNGVNADRATGDDVPEIAAGASVTWTYRVTNNGGEALENIVVTDSVEGPVTCPETTLAPGASMDCTLEGAALALFAQGMVVTGTCQGETNRKLYRNTATVAADGVNTATAVGDSDSSHYCNPKPVSEVIFSSGFE
jgi:hypothetical protein